MSRMSDAIERIVFARNYTRELIATFAPDQWFQMPAEGVTHLAWQVGHLAMAQYRLCLERLRGVRPEDEQLISAEFLKLFIRESVVDPDRTIYPTPGEIVATFDRVHEQLLRELPNFPDAELDSGIFTTHRFCKTKIELVRWCSAHEMLHAGQIGLLRRLFGHKPMW